MEECWMGSCGVNFQEVDTMGQRKLLVDGMALVHPSYNVMKRVATPSGVRVGMVYGFLQSLLSQIRKRKATDVTICWESGYRSSEDGLVVQKSVNFPCYKSGRKKTTADFKDQHQKLLNVLRHTHWKQCRWNGHEADDLLAVLARQYEQDEDVDEVLILTSDSDLWQVLTEKIKVVWTNEERDMTVEKLREKKGISPRAWRMWKAIHGDYTDKIKSMSFGRKLKSLIDEKLREYSGVGEMDVLWLKNSISHEDKMFRLEFNKSISQLERVFELVGVGDCKGLYDIEVLSDGLSNHKALEDVLIHEYHMYRLGSRINEMASL